MSTLKFSMFTPGRGSKAQSYHASLDKDHNENPFRTKKHKKHTRTNSKINQKDSGICKNCGIQGHPVWKCQQPRTSYGLILFRGFDIEHIEIIMIKRKDSYSYLSLVKNVDIDNAQFNKIAQDITIKEKQKLLTKSFSDMWSELYSHTRYKNAKKVYYNSRDRFENHSIRSIVYNTNTDNLQESVSWSIPKGKLKGNETWKECALREVKEEINVSKHQIKTIDDTPIYHLKTGNDNRQYLNIYYIAHIDETANLNLKAQPTEIQTVEWKPLKCLKENINISIVEVKKRIHTLLRNSTQDKNSPE